MKPLLLPSAVEWSHYLLRQVVTPGDHVVDATAGNGHDTLFLAQLVGTDGHVHAFDVQAGAIEATRQRLLAEDCFDRCTLHHAGHEHLRERLPVGSYAAMVFNLGYLPGGEKSRITQTETTLDALRQAADMVAIGGALVVVTYPGHAGGDEEAAAVAAHFSALDAVRWNVQHIRCANRPSRRPPECWAVVKKQS